MRRKLSTMIAVAAGLVAMMTASTSGAAVVGGGEVGGNVTITSPSTGIPLDCSRRAAVTYTFDSVFLNGSLSDTDSRRVFAGQIETFGVRGASSPAGDCAQFGAGTVNTASSPATFIGINPVTSQGIHGSFYGTYTRTGSHTVVELNVTGRFCESTPNDGSPSTWTGCTSYFTEKVTLAAAEFIPTELDPTTNGIKKATFAGEFHVES